MESDCFFIRITDARISIIIAQIFNNELLPNVYNFANRFWCQTDEFDSKFIGSNSDNLTFLIELNSGDRASIISDF